MYNMPYPFIPDPNMNQSNQLDSLKQQIAGLEREFRKLEHRVRILESNKQPFISTTKDNDTNNDSGMYMV